MSYAPAKLMEARSYIIAKTGLSGASVGIVGDAAHGGEGYHVGWDALRQSYGWADYSVSESVRDRNPTNGAMALDIGQFSRLRELSLWLVAQCQAGAPGTQDIREIIYTPDGYTVKRWDRLNRRFSGDSSHLYHTHISYFRDSESRDKTALFRRFFEGDPTPSVDLEEIMAVGSVPFGAEPVVVPTSWQRSVISFGCDYGSAKLRVAEHTVNGNWDVTFVTVNAADGARKDLPARDNCDRRSVVRVPIDETDPMTTPVGYMTYYL